MKREQLCNSGECAERLGRGVPCWYAYYKTRVALVKSGKTDVRGASNPYVIPGTVSSLDFGVTYVSHSSKWLMH